MVNHCGKSSSFTIYLSCKTLQYKDKSGGWYCSIGMTTEPDIKGGGGGE